MDEQEKRLASRSAAIAKDLMAADDLMHTLARVVALAQDLVDGADAAGVALFADASPPTSVSTPGIGERFDELHRELLGDTCREVMSQHDYMEIVDLAEEQRWPILSRLGIERTGVRSMIGLRLFVEKGQELGVLHLYATRPHAFGARDRAHGWLLAAHAAAAIRAAQRQQQLIDAVAWREVIGQAKGIIMARQGVDADTAFALLQAVSSRTNRTVRDVARDLVKRHTRG